MKNVLCAFGIHDIQYVKKPMGVSKEYVDLRSDVYTIISKVSEIYDYPSLLREKFQDITNHSDEYKVCLREECDYVKDMEQIAMAHLERYKKKLGKKYRVHVYKDQRTSAALEKALRISNPQKNNGALSMPATDGSLSVAENGQLSIHDKELLK